MATSRKTTKTQLTTHVGSVKHDGVGFFAIKMDIDTYMLDIVYFNYDDDTEILKPDAIVHTGIVGNNLLDIVEGIENLINTGMFLDIPPVHVGVLIDSDDGSIVTDIHWCQFTDAFKELEALQTEIFGDDFPVYDCEDEEDSAFIEVVHKPSIKPTLSVGEAISKPRINIDDVIPPSKPTQRKTAPKKPATAAVEKKVTKPPVKRSTPAKKPVTKTPAKITKPPAKKPVAKKVTAKSSAATTKTTRTTRKPPSK